MDSLVRALLYVAVGGLLLLANIVFVRSLWQSIHSSDIVIAPLLIVGEKAEDTKLGDPLAHMLQGRLQSIAAELQAAQDSLRTAPLSPELPLTGSAEELAGLILPTSSVRIPTALLEPVNLNIAVGGVEVGGVLPWLQRKLTRPRTLTFAVLIKNDTATITGDISALTKSAGQTLWLQSRPTPDRIVDRIAYALLQSKLAADRASKIGVLAIDEFETLLGVVSDVAVLNNRAKRGRPAAKEEFAGLLRRVDPLVQEVPRWYELTYLAARLADGAGATDRALRLYQEALNIAEDTSVGAVARTLDQPIRKRIAALRPGAETPLVESEADFVTAATRYAAQMGLPGPEPTIVVVPREQDQNVYTLWKNNPPRQEVSRHALGTPGMPAFAALNGRFMAKHYVRCLGENADRNLTEVRVWNEVRLGAIGYLITSTVPEAKASALFARPSALGSALTLMEAEHPGDRPAVNKLAVAVLDRFECDWRVETLPAKVANLNRELKLLPDHTITKAFAAAAET